MGAFRTQQGSVYALLADDPRRTRRVVTGDGRTPDGEWSIQTVYVRPWVAFFLQIRLEAGGRLAASGVESLRLWLPDGRVVFFPQEGTPAAGLHPVEHYGDSWHIGHVITEASPAAAAASERKGDRNGAVST